MVQFQIVHRTSTNSDALAYAHFHFSRTHGKSPKEVSELTKAARRCGEALRGGRGSSSDSSASNSLPEKRRRNKKVKSLRYDRQPQPQQMYVRPQYQQYAQMGPPQRKSNAEKACYTCKLTGHLAKDCGKFPVKKEA